MALKRSHIRTFEALADTLLPAVAGDGPAWTEPGGSLGFGEELRRVFEFLPHDQDRRDVERFLGLLGSAAGGLALHGTARPFSKMAAHQRADAFRRLEGHPVSLVRGGAKALKTLIAFMWVATDEPGRRPPAWDAMGYPGPDGPAPDTPKQIPLSRIDGDTQLECDVVVVGSGAGGGTAAGVLSAAGLDVVILEAGRYMNESDFTHLEADAYRGMYLDKALSSTADGGIQILAGSTLGGGTLINYSTSFPTPDDVRAEWDEAAGFSGVFTSEEYTDSSSNVQARLEVNTDFGRPSTRAELMEKGLRELGWHVDEMPRNAVGCTEEQCGYCTMGCRIGAKRSMLATFLEDAADDGARFVTEANVERVTTSGGAADGVIARVGNSELTVRARAVVLAAGALHTPAILLRSQLGGKAVGDYLRLHPVTAVWARFDQLIEPWTGVLQTRYCDEFTNLDGAGYGFKFETAPVHPLFPAGFMGWNDGASFKRDVLGLGHMSVGGILLRDRGHGRVTTRRDGSAVWKYKISKHDQGHIREGVRRAAEMYAAAGAEEVISSTMRPVRWRPDSGSLEDFMDDVDAVGYGSNRTSYFTFHQMGSARMGQDPATSVVDAENEAHQTPGLFVMDGSCFPTASGVNPMLSIASIAHRGATLLADRLG